ncbi:hypothetical protein HY502_03860, partial [Candidatus Woesebacteria bacterium]|nr:hypothetical protein [Candidatus Woesebacteria bacterium]
MTQKQFDEVSIHPLQSWKWGEFRKAVGNEVVRFPFGQVTLHKIPFTPFKVGAFIKGPKPTKKMLDDLKDLGKKENLIFVKLEPNSPALIYEDDKNSVHVHSKNVISDDFERSRILLKEYGAVPGKTLFTPTT